MAPQKQRSVDEASLQMIDVAGRAGIPTAWDRLELQQPQCGFGRLGICCRNCFMGPCRIDPFGNGAQDRHLRGHGRDDRGAKPAAAYLLRHGRPFGPCPRLDSRTAAGGSRAPPTSIPSRVLRRSAGWPDEYGIAQDGRSDGEVAGDVARLLLSEFGRQEGVLLNTRRAPDQQQKNWKSQEADPAGNRPRGGDRDARHARGRRQ